MHPNNSFRVEPPARFHEALPIPVGHTQAAFSPARRAVMRMAGHERPRADGPGDTQRDSAEHRRVGYTYLQG
jgi:hypothetical protein